MKFWAEFQLKMWRYQAALKGRFKPFLKRRVKHQHTSNCCVLCVVTGEIIQKNFAAFFTTAIYELEWNYYLILSF